MLTAFLIESYTALQPDPQSQIIYLLERIAAQTYTTGPGFLNTTSSLPGPPQFEVPIWALRVNGLWFSSLIVSLAAASIGILVKSWLREYLAGEWISPQEKLRARQYRNPALKQWKVFDIAALLPLLLQVALGLFFIGLCFFTASVDERMALTSVPLVSAWAFFLAMTTLAPLLTPRCPFKVAFLKRALKSGRRYLVPGVLQLIQPLTTKAGWKPSIGPEEDEVVLRRQEDADLLLSIDTIMSDDSLLSTLWDALKQSAQPEDLIRFAIRLVRNRIAPGLDPTPSGDLAYFMDLSALSQDAYNAIMRIVADALAKYASPPYQNSSPAWAHNAAILLLSKSSHSLPVDALSALHAFFDDWKASWWVGDTLGIRVVPALQRGQAFLPLSPQLRHLYMPSSISRRLDFGSVLQLYNKMLKAVAKVDDNVPSLLTLFRRYPALLVDENARPVLADLWDFLIEALRWLCVHTEDRGDGTMECFLFVVDFGTRLGKKHEVTEIISKAWAVHDMRFLVASLFCSAAPHMRVQNAAEASDLSQEAFFLADSKGTVTRPPCV